MPAFTYKAKARTGEIVTGTLDADSRGAANARLQAMGYYPLDIRGGDAPAAATAGAPGRPAKAKAAGGSLLGRVAGPGAARKTGGTKSGASGGIAKAFGDLFGGKSTVRKPAPRAAARPAPRTPARASRPKPSGAAPARPAFSFGAPRVKSLDLSNFYRQMADLIGAGVPLVKALSIIKAQTSNPALVSILTQVNTDVQEGATFAGALEKHAAVFNKLNVALVHAGEAGGLLDQTLSRIADFSESQDELRAKVKSAMAYPAIMVLVGFSAVTVLLTYVMPKVLMIFDDLNQTLPWITLALIALTKFLHQWWMAMIGGLVLAVFAFRRWSRSDAGSRQYHLLLLKIPKFGDLLLKREIAGFTRTLGSLLRNGVPILNALSISAEVMSIRPVREEIERVPESITQGAGMAASLRGSPLFPPVVVNMVSIGEETGHLPDVLLRVAQSYETQVERDIKTLTSFIEPIIILLLGVVVFIIVMAMLLPIFSLDPTAGT